MNLCVDCIHFRSVKRRDSKGNCSHPQAVISYSPVDGSATYKSAEEMRSKITLCRISGVHFQPNPAGTVTVKPSLMDRIGRWYR
jgi:hypothetical protein